MFSFLRPSFSETNVSAVGFCCCAGWQALTQPPKQPSVSAGLGCRATLWSTLQAHQKLLYTLICFVSFIDITNTSIIISVTNFLRNSYPCAVNCTNRQNMFWFIPVLFIRVSSPSCHKLQYKQMGGWMDSHFNKTKPWHGNFQKWCRIISPCGWGRSWQSWAQMTQFLDHTLSAFLR